jgi:hypothetical protein
VARSAAAAAVVLGAVASGGGCYTHQCDGGTIAFTGGEMANESTYETSPFDDPSHPWLNFPGQTTIVVGLPESVRRATAGRGIHGFQTWLSQSGKLDDPGNQVTSGSGQPAVLSDAGSGGFMVSIESCQQYFVRVEVAFYPADAGPD